MTLYDASATTKNARDNGTGNLRRKPLSREGAQQGLQIHNTLTSKALAVNTGGSIELGTRWRSTAKCASRGVSRPTPTTSRWPCQVQREPLFAHSHLSRLPHGGSNDETRRLPMAATMASDGCHYGFIAQEVQAAVPSCSTSSRASGSAVRETGRLLTEATKEMSSTIEAHRRSQPRPRSRSAIELLAERLSASRLATISLIAGRFNLNPKPLVQL